MIDEPIDFASVALCVAERRWRPFPGVARDQSAGNAGLAWP